MSIENRIQKKSPSGFTLLEMMVTLVLLTMILSMCHAILFATIESKEKVEALVSSGKIAQGILSVIQRDLEACYAYEQEHPLSSKNNQDQDELNFLAWMPSQNKSENPLQQIHYVLKPNPNDSEKFIFFRGFAPKGSDNYAYQEIYDQVLELNFQYWSGEKWEDDWKEKTLPLAVKIWVKVPKEGLNPISGKKNSTETYYTIVSLIQSGK